MGEKIINDGVEAETRKSPARFQIIQVSTSTETRMRLFFFFFFFFFCRLLLPLTDPMFFTHHFKEYIQ